MTFGPAPKNAPGINPDTVHLMALNDQVAQLITWATAVQSTVRVLLAKRMPIPEPPVALVPQTPSIQATTSVVAVPPIPIPPTATQPKTNTGVSKADLRFAAVAAGIPDALIMGPDYLNHPSRPTLAGVTRTKDLIQKVQDMKSSGDDPTTLWSTAP